MKTTLYWDDDSLLIYWTDGEVWRCYTKLFGWRESYSSKWKPEQFKKSLTVNNFIEK